MNGNDSDLSPDRPWHLHWFFSPYITGSLGTSKGCDIFTFFTVSGDDLTTLAPMPRFLKTPTNVTFNKGEDAVLQCAIQSIGTRTVSWLPWREWFSKIKHISQITRARFLGRHWNLWLAQGHFVQWPNLGTPVKKFDHHRANVGPMRNSATS